MTREKIMVELFEFSAPTYYKWTKHQKRKIFDLLNYAFSEEELIEFISSNKIKRIEKEKSYELLFTSSLTFFKHLTLGTNYLMAKKAIKLLEEHYVKNKSSIKLDKFIEELYLKDKKFFVQDDLFGSYKEISFLKYEIVKIFQEQSIAVLEYTCINLEEIVATSEDLIEEDPDYMEFENYSSNEEDEDNGNNQNYDYLDRDLIF